jgi:uncharacterized protein (DUF2267 family)
MTYEQFITRVQWVGGFDSKRQAERAARATLEILARRIGKAEAGHLLRQVPPKVAAFFRHEKAVERFGVDEFINLVAEHEGVARQDAVHHARAVIGVLQEQVKKGEIKELLSLLPADFASLFSESAGMAASKITG